MADATHAARDRVEQALALLERRVNALKTARVVPDDDLFTLPDRPSAVAADKTRIAELETAGQAASEALAQAAEALRQILSQTQAEAESR